MFRDRLCGIFTSVVIYICLAFTRIRRRNITSNLKMLSLKDQEFLFCYDVSNYFPCRWYSYILIKIRKASKHTSLALVYLIRSLTSQHLSAIHCNQGASITLYSVGLRIRNIIRLWLNVTVTCHVTLRYTLTGHQTADKALRLWKDSQLYRHLSMI
jgi:hypothetical protein